VLLADRFEQVDAIDLSGPMIELARPRRPRPNITYWQADLHDVGGVGRYDFVLSVLTLHHVPDLHAALSHIKTLLAPGGRVVVVDMYPPESALRSPQSVRHPGRTARHRAGLGRAPLAARPDPRAPGCGSPMTLRLRGAR